MPPKQRRKSSGLGSPEQQAKRQKVANDTQSQESIQEFFNTTLSLVQDLRDGKTQITLDFLRLPSKKLYPDYYKGIQSPISLCEITSNVKTGQYSSTQEFLDDFKLMASNANQFNESSSDIARNSLIISKFVEDQIKQFNGELTSSAGSSIKLEHNTPKLPKIKLRTSAPPSTPSTPSGQGSIKKPLLDIIQQLIDYEVDGIRIGDPFFEEVNRKEFPDYFQVIEQPMALNSVKKHINGNRMKSIEQFQMETDLIWKNAQLYNEESSLLYQDSKTLEHFAHERIEELKRLNSQSTPSSKKKPAFKLKAKPPAKSNLKIHLSVKKEATPVEEVPDEAKDEINLENEEKETDESKEIEAKESDGKNKGEQNGDTKTDEGDKKLEPVDPLQAIKSTRKRSSKQTAADALIQEISISSSRTIYKQQVRSQSTNQIPPIFQNWFEYRFEANDFQVQSYTLSLPPQQGSVSVLAALNDLLADRKHQANLTVNGERVNPIPSIQYSDSERRLTSRYELKLAVGLNMVVFEVAVDPVFNEESRLRSQDAAPYVEKLTFWIQIVQ